MNYTNSFQFTNPNQSFFKNSASKPCLQKADAISLIPAALSIYQLYFSKVLAAQRDN